MVSLKDARRFYGLLDTLGIHEGARVEGTADETSIALKAIGTEVTHDPVEDGPPGAPYLGALRTLGSPWLEVTEPSGQGFLTERLLRELSKQMGRLTFSFRYAFDHHQYHHRLFAQGVLIEELDAPSSTDPGVTRFRSARRGSPSHGEVATDPQAYIRSLFATLRIRDWGVGVRELATLAVPFPPPLIVECYFLRIVSPPR